MQNKKYIKKNIGIKIRKCLRDILQSRCNVVQMYWGIFFECKNTLDAEIDRKNESDGKLYRNSKERCLGDRNAESERHT